MVAVVKRNGSCACVDSDGEWVMVSVEELRGVGEW